MGVAEELEATGRSGWRPAVSPQLPVRQGSGALPQTVITTIAFVLIGIALVPTLIQVFLDKPLYYPDAKFTLSNFTRLVTDPEVVGTLWATAVFSVIVVAFSMFFGTLLAILVGRTDLPGRGIFFGILLWPLFISPQVIGFGAIMSYGPSGFMTVFVGDLLGLETPWNLYSITGIALVTGVASVPITILYCIAAARQQDPNHDAAARVMGASPFRILMRVTLPLMRPALIFAFIMNLVHALETLAIPLVLGGPVGIRLLTTLIYDKTFQSGNPEYGLVAAMALALMLLVGILFWVQRKILARADRFVSIGSRAGRSRTLPLGRLRWPLFAFVLIYIVLGTVIILGAVGVRSVTHVFSPFVSPLEVLTWQNFIAVLSVDVYVRSIRNTLILAVIGATCGTAFVAAVAFVAQRSEFRYRRYVDMLGQMPRVIPGLIVGLGVFYASVFVPGLSILRNTIWLLLIAYMIRFLSSGYGIVSPGLFQVSQDFDRAAKSVGAGWPVTIRRIVSPLMKPALLSCFILLMILIIKEYSSAVFLMAPGSEVIGSTMLSLWLQGQTGPVAALAVLQIALTGIMVVIANRLLGVKLHG